MQVSRDPKKLKFQQRGCRALCCASSSEETESSVSDRFPSVSSLAHTMVQERLDQMIREKQEKRYDKQKRRAKGENTKFVVMVAMEKSSCDPREDFRESVFEMIRANNLYKVNDLRRLLNFYLSINPDGYRGVILEVFYEVCTNLL